MFAKNAYVQIYMQDKLTQNDIGFQQHSYCNTNINVILLGYCYNDQELALNNNYSLTLNGKGN
jgi:hypothetical protein